MYHNQQCIFTRCWADDRYLLMSDARHATREEWKLSVFASAAFALCLVAPLGYGCRASETRGTPAACCPAPPELAASAAVETGRVDQWSRAGTGSAFLSCILLHSYTSGDTQLQRARQEESCYITDGQRLPKFNSSQLWITSDEKRRENLTKQAWSKF